MENTAEPTYYRTPYRIAKRILDITASVFALLLLAPVLLVVALIVRVKIGTPILFSQERPGLHGKIFKIKKFRTMTNETDSHGVLLPDEQRLPRIGKWLRASSLDELPSLINVIAGDLTLVGPRPLIPEYLPLYSTEQARRHDVVPGLTGWAQVNGRNALSWENKFRYDVWYVDNQSLLLDLKIILLTVFKVLKKDGISSEGHVTMPPFRGSQAETLD